jgi:hypothetical protein
VVGGDNIPIFMSVFLELIPFFSPSACQAFYYLQCLLQHLPLSCLLCCSDLSHLHPHARLSATSSASTELLECPGRSLREDASFLCCVGTSEGLPSAHRRISCGRGHRSRFIHLSHDAWMGLLHFYTVFHCSRLDLPEVHLD